MANAKKKWEAPAITVFGDVAVLTQQAKLKTPGLTDDFGVTGISDA